MWRDWVQGNEWEMIGTTNIRENYGSGGWFHVYAFTMTIGILLAIAYSLYKFKKQRLAGENLIWGAAVIVPISLFGASFFGKLNANGIGQNAGDANFWQLFAFWEPGMSIHGGVLFGLVAGIIIFGFVGRKPRVSLWSYFDAIVPNILLGQGVGRWGNFFNHEIVGAPLFKIGDIDLTGATRSGSGVIDFNDLLGHGLNLPKSLIGRNTLAYNAVDGSVYQMMPLFLIESLSLLALWVIITFIVPNIGKWLGPKPWKRQPKIFQLTPLPTQPSFQEKIKLAILNEHQRHQIWNDVALNRTQPRLITSRPQGASKLINRWNQGQDLIEANNPYHYWLTKVGCEGSMYFFGWNLIRFFLEMSRPDDHLFIMYDKPLSLGLIGLMAFVGLLGMVFTQIVIPQFTRKTGWLYEQNYLYSVQKTALVSSQPTSNIETATPQQVEQ